MLTKEQIHGFAEALGMHDRIMEGVPEDCDCPDCCLRRKLPPYALLLKRHKPISKGNRCTL